MCAKRDRAVGYVCYIPQVKFKQSKKQLKIVTSLNVRERIFILKYQRPVNKNKLWTKKLSYIINYIIVYNILVNKIQVVTYNSHVPLCL